MKTQTNYASFEAKPTANITIKHGRTKIYKAEDKYTSFEAQTYLNDGQEFEIELFNPTTEKILAKIHLNGKEISNKGIVLRPGERIYLERYLDTPEKFKFSTYKVKNNSIQVDNAIRNNGLVEVYFHKKDGYVTNGNSITWTTMPYVTHTGTGTPIWNDGTVTCNLSDNTTSSNCFYLSTNLNNNLNLNGTLTTASYTSASYIEPNFKETGTVEKGSNSNQSFENDNDIYSEWSFHRVVYKILPTSEKIITKNDLNKEKAFCPYCGKKSIKKGFKFCPECGKEL